MKTVAIIQARIGSTRLPRKVLMEINGKPMLWHIINRVKQSKLINDIVVATTTNDEDKAIINLVRQSGVKGFRGSENDVLDRYYQTVAIMRLSHSRHIDAIVRITSDCPLIDPKVIDKTIGLFQTGNYDYVSNTGTYPDGLDTEVFSFDALRKAWVEAIDPYDREHVTPYIINHPGLFRIGKLGKYINRFKWSVDTEQDLEFVRWIYQELGDNFHLEDIIELLK